MQFFWVCSSLGKIRSVNLSKKVQVLLIVFLILLLSSALEGLKQFTSEIYQLIVKSSQAEITLSSQKIKDSNSTFLNPASLESLNAELENYALKIAQLEAVNQRLIALATPPALNIELKKSKAMGGPYLPIPPTKRLYVSKPKEINELHLDLLRKNEELTHSIEELNKLIVLLERSPIGHPLNQKYGISSKFGNRADPIKNELSGHQGIDFSAPHGTIIYSSGAGIVEKAGWDREYGKAVLINHGNGYKSKYAHASEILVSAGTKVNRKVAIAKVGSSGRSTGPHLHFEIHKEGLPVDPQQWITREAHQFTELL